MRRSPEKKHIIIFTVTDLNSLQKYPEKISPLVKCTIVFCEMWWWHSASFYIQLQEFQAMAGMLEFWRSLLRQSNPSTLTAAGLGPNFILTHPPLRAEDEGEDKPDGDG